MLKRNIVLLLVWNFFWLGFAVDQIQISVEALQQSNNIYGDRVVVDRNGTKFLVDKNKLKNDKFDADHTCGDEDLWKNNFIHNFDFETSTLEIEYIGSKTQQEKIKKTSIVVNPMTYGDYQKGFDYLNYKVITFDAYEEKVKIPIVLTQSRFESSYTTELTFEAFQSGKDGVVRCHAARVELLNHENYSQYQSPAPFYKEDLISLVNMKNPIIANGFIKELQYIEQYVDKRNFNLLNNELPSIDESTVALLYANVSPLKDGYEWKVEKSLHIPVIQDELVIGLFGDVEDIDLLHLERLTNALRVVAPELDISYSLNEEHVTLPIHFSRCTKEFSKKFNDCYNNMWGFFVPTSTPKHGWIWIDSSLKDTDRLSTLTHELGHALGLKHNLCHKSVMSYSTYADQDVYFTHVDLMMLQAIYSPEVSLWKDKVIRTALVEAFDLNENKVFEKRGDISSTCHREPGAYDYLIDMQLGKEW